MSTTPEVIIFTQPGCPTCLQLKNYLEAKGVAYRERDLTTDEGAMQELHDRGFAATPLTVIGQDEILGMNRPRLEAALQQLREAVS